MFENIALAFQGIWSHKLRSFLTMLGIIIGIGSIIAIVSTIKGTNEQIKENLIGSGNNTVSISIYRGDSPMSFDYEGVPDGLTQITEETMSKIQALKEVAAATKYVERTYSGNVFRGDTAYNGAVRGIEPDYFSVAGYEVYLGRTLEDSDLAGYTKVAILDATAAATLFPNENPVGKTLEVAGEPFTVAGLVRKSSRFEPVIKTFKDYNTYMSRSAGEIFIPSAVWPVVYMYDEPEKVLLRATDTDSMTDAGKKAADILSGTVTAQDITYRSEDLLEQAKKLQDLSSSTNKQLIWIASISLLVGGIGVMNIMLVSVTERTREIGLKKAIGAKKARILRQFLTEAAVLTSIGGLIGVGAGIIMARVVSGMSGAPMAIDVTASAIAVAFSMVIGIVFGFIPAVKASNLNPIEALRRD